MAYDENLANRIREELATQPNVEEKKMMGGIAFMVNEKMCVGIIKDELMCRINPDDYENALEENGCREMDFTGRAMRGFVMVEKEVLVKKSQIKFWINLALKYNAVAKKSPKRNKKTTKRSK